jgi:hypothetical protein
MFGDMKCRWWLLSMANKELAYVVAPGDVAKLTARFESDMRRDHRWPFKDPDTLALAFGAWAGRNAVGLGG